MPSELLRAFAIGARQFVVQEPFDTIFMSEVSTSSFTPYTTVASQSVPGAEISTFFAPLSR